MNEGRKKASQADKMINVIIAIVIVAFVAVGVYATYGKISEGIEEKAITSGEKQATVEYLAKQSSMSVEDYLAQYGLSLGDTIKNNTTESEMLENMTIENYAKYNGQEAESMLEGLSDSVTKDTVFKDFMAMPAKTVLGEEVFNQTKEQYGMGDEVTDETSWEDFQTALYTKAMEQQQAQAQTQESTAPAAE